MKLIVAEKPSVGKEIAKAVGAEKKEHGYLSGNGYIVSWCIGHLITPSMPAAYDERYKKWSFDMLPIIPETWKYEVVDSTKAQYQVLKELMNRKDVDSLICATDAGREGELIFRHVYNQAKCKKPFDRLWINSVEKKAILAGMADLKPSAVYDNLYHAARCRQQADWIVGMNESRLYSIAYDVRLNIGRVQTPTLALIVKQYNNNKLHIPKEYWILSANMGTFKATKRTEFAEEIPQIKVACVGKQAYVTSVRAEEKKVTAPTLYSLSTLQADANKYFGYTLQQTLDCAQLLYEKKLSTYPRSDSNYLPTSMLEDSTALLHNLLECDKTSYIQNKEKISFSVEKLINDAKVTDHHAIIPTGHFLQADITALPEIEKNILVLICGRFMAAASTPYMYMSTQVLFDVNEHTFSASGTIVKEEGFRRVEAEMLSSLKGVEVDNDATEEEEKHVQNLPEFKEGDEIQVLDVTDKKYHTRPPLLFTDKTVLEAMKNAGNTIANEELKSAIKQAGGLGTEATRANILESLVKNTYIVRNKKQIVPTPKGIQLIEEVLPELKDPELTASWEQQLEDIAAGNGKCDPQQFMKNISDFISQHIKNAIEYEYNDLKFTKGIFESDKPLKPILGICPRCGKNIFEGKSNFYCEGSRDCGFSLWKKDKFLESRNTKIDASNIVELLKTNTTEITCKNKEGKPYKAIIAYTDSGKYVNYKFLNFAKSKN